MANSSAAARRRTKGQLLQEMDALREQLDRAVRVPERAERLAGSFLTTVTDKVTREELLQIMLLRGAQEIDRYPDRVLGHLYEVRQARKGAAP